MAKTRRRNAKSRPETELQTPPPLYQTRAGVLIACIVIFAATVVGYAGNGIFQVISIIRDETVFVGAWIGSAALLGSVLLRVLRVNDRLDSALWLSTAAGLGLGVYSLAGLGLGLAGALNRGTAVLLPLVSICLWAVVFYRDRRPLMTRPLARMETWLRQPAGWGALWIAAMPFLAMAAVAATLPPGLLWPGDPHPYDVLEYHLQVPREWYEARRILPLPHNVFSFFPFNVEIQYLLFMHIRGGPWAPMYAAQFLMLGYMVLMMLAVTGAARTPAGKVIGGVAAATTPWILMLGSVAYDEGGLLLYATLGIVWMLRAMSEQTALTPALVLAGIFAGLACGAKLTAVPMVLVGLPIAAVVAMLLGRIRPTRYLPGFGVFFLAGLIIFSPWLIRNWRWAGNPVFPEAMSVLGRGHFSPLQEKRWELAHAPRPDQHSVGAHLHAAFREIVLDWRYGFLLVPLSIAAAVLGFRAMEGRVLLTLLIFLMIFWIGFTHMQSRFFVLGIPIAAMLFGQVTQLRFELSTGAIVLLAAVIGWVNVHPDLHKMTAVAENSVWHADLPNLQWLLPNEATALADKLILIGDARAYLYPMPMSHLRYKTVFDVDNSNGRDLIVAWQGSDRLPEGWEESYDWNELGRMRSYYGIPDHGVNRPTTATIRP